MTNLDTKGWEQTEDLIKVLLEGAFVSGFDQGVNEVQDPDFESFYRNCWEDKVKFAIKQLLSSQLSELTEEIGKMKGTT